MKARHGSAYLKHVTAIWARSKSRVVLTDTRTSESEWPFERNCVGTETWWGLGMSSCKRRTSWPPVGFLVRSRS
jgi:hypothetical protein